MLRKRMSGSSASLTGRIVAGKYRIEEHVGGGAMGDVYRARHVTLDSVIALKIMRSDIAKDDMFKERFVREAKAASRLDHANSVRVLDFGAEDDGLVYLAMEFLHGRDLLTLLRDEWPLSDQKIVDILVQTLSAVGAAHALGIVHRDLKPENIMVATAVEDDGTPVLRVKVCDFGIAKLNDPRGFQTEAGKALTSSGTLIGTPEYMSPEQARGDPLDARSDLYSLGVVLYQLLTGKLPFTGENALGIVLKQVTDEPTAPSSVRPGVNPRLEAICKRAMRKPRDDRYQTAKEMRADLRAVFGYRQSSQIDESQPQIPVPPTSSSPDDISNAPTLANAPSSNKGGTLVAPVALSAQRPSNDFSPKATSDGTELPARSSGTPKWIPFAIVGAIALLVGVAGVVIVATRGPDGKTVASGSASAPISVASGTVPPIVPSGTPVDTAAPPTPTTKPTTPVGTTTGASVHASGKHPTTAPSGKTSAAVTASTPPPPTAPVTTPPVETAAPFDPASAHVNLGLLTALRVREDVMRGKMSAAAPQLSECYRSALRMAGKAVPGSAEIHMSIDERGNMQSMVLAPKHPEFARCAQSVLAGQRVPTSALESGSAGATATQMLTLQP